jgi:hypothetical protein
MQTIFANGSVTDQIEEDKADQFKAMYYNVECETCGMKVTWNVLSNDFTRPLLIADMMERIVSHNMTHYEAPKVVGCNADPIFGTCDGCGGDDH